ncbi:MAG: hypothetical protein KA750_00160 [Thermoflexales bacterium]|nr:hypothetical protein [Thermoflexales bacterium]
MLNLTKRQRHGLELSLRFHSTRPPTLGDLMGRDAPVVLSHLVIGAVLSTFMFAIGVPVAGAFCFGMFLGAVLRLIRGHRTYVSNWPVVDRITQWDLVEALVHPPAPVAEAAAPVEPPL